MEVNANKLTHFLPLKIPSTFVQLATKKTNKKKQHVSTQKEREREKKAI